jgi:hypothetical protein
LFTFFDNIFELRLKLILKLFYKSIQDEQSLKTFFGAAQDETIRMINFFCCSYTYSSSSATYKDVIKQLRKKLRKIKSLSNGMLTVAGIQIKLNKIKCIFK